MAGPEPAAGADALAGFRSGDPGAMTALIRDYHAPLVAWLIGLGVRREPAEEAAQEAFVAAWRQRADIRDTARLKSWLFTVARRHVQKRESLLAARSEVACDPDVLESVAPLVGGGQTAGLARDDARAWVERALAALPVADREILSLRYFGELSIREISEVLGMPLGSVGVKLQRALAKGRQELERQGVAPEDLL